ncbi:MAG: hypothetical protein EOO29_12110 [Comamonadaceae bacterium]|nr:MAG: hypothetical protein EOO29_12110 [Comamonadaceae bacterium]
MKALTQYIVVGVLALLAAATVAQGGLGHAELGWAQAAAEVAGPAAAQGLQIAAPVADKP